MTPAVRKAVLPVAGLGTRFLPATKSVPKELLPIVDKPLIQYAIDECRDAGIEEFIFVNSADKPAIESYMGSAPYLENHLREKNKTAELEQLQRSAPGAGRYKFVIQEQALGLGHAVWCAKSLIGKEPFAIVLPDDLVNADTGCMTQLVNAYHRTGGNIVAVENVPRDQTKLYGVLDPGETEGNLTEVMGLVEKPDPEVAPSTLSIFGRYILLPEVFDYLDAHETGAGGEIQLTDAMAKMIGTKPFHGIQIEGTRYDCGTKLGFLHANLALAMKRKEFSAELAPLVKSILEQT
jgi:UTP--glucose-1-phosphate uridylyltransferase